METPHLFSHTYDIDTIIAALCAPTPQWLETDSGTLSITEPTHISENRRFPISPLPSIFLTSLPGNPEVEQLSPEHRTQLEEVLSNATIQTLPSLFTNSRVGGWLRERVKEAALEWLDVNDLIPPSMRHINRQKALKLARSVTITPPEETHS